MSGRTGGQRPIAGSILVGVARLARGRADGIQQFGATRDSFLASLAPLVAFPLVGGVLGMLSGDVVGAATDFLATLCALLAPPVLSFEVARLWGRQAAWLRYATAFNWCQWAIPLVGSVLLTLLGVLMVMGLPRRIASAIAILGLAGYGLWLHWFVTRHGLELSRGRAALLVVGVNLATVIIVMGPRLLALSNDAPAMDGK
jgi:hypothetical protein